MGASALGQGLLILHRTADTRRSILFEVAWGSGSFSFQSPLPPPEVSAHSALCEVPLPSIPLQVSTTRFKSQAYHYVTQMCLCESLPRGRACPGPRGGLPGNLCLRQAFNRGTLLNSNQEKDSLLLTGIHL